MSERGAAPPDLPPLRIGTRGSPLALWQAHRVAELIGQHRDRAAWPVEIVEIQSSAEKHPEQDFVSLGVGLFTREIDRATLEGAVDIGVHSLKDLPTTSPDGLYLAAVPERHSPYDAWVSATGTALEDLPRGARVGTSSPRRAAQLLHRRADLQIVPMRGNVGTRLRKIDELELAGTVLAAAGLRRLGREDLISCELDTEWIVPAVAQGALAVVAREDRDDLRAVLARLECARSRCEVDAERAFLHMLRGGCQVPAGALGRVDTERGTMTLEAVVARPDGSDVVRTSLRGESTDAVKLGERAARELLDRGADQFLAELDRPGH